MAGIPPKLPTGSRRKLLDAIVAMNQPVIGIFRDGRKPWRVGSWSGPAAKYTTFGRLEDEGWIKIVYGFAGSASVSVTEQTLAAYASSSPRILRFRADLHVLPGLRR